MSDTDNSILRGLDEALAMARGDDVDAKLHWPEVPDAVDVRRVRKGLGLTQSEFAERFGFSLGAVRHWEQGRRLPEPGTKTLLRLIDEHPELVAKYVERPAIDEPRQGTAARGR